MAIGSGMVKPFAAAWRARGYFIFAFIFWLIHSTISVPFASVPNKAWWQDLIDKAVGSFDKIAYLIAIAGLVYAVISDVLEYVWLNNLQGETQKALGEARSDLNKGLAETGNILKSGLANFTAGLVGMTFESVKVWIENGRGEPHQVRSVAHCALVNYYGEHSVEADSFLSFSLEDMLDNWALASAQTWEGMSSSVTIRGCDIPDHFEWQENRNYTVVCPSSSGTLPFRLEGSFQVRASDVLKAMDRLDFRVRFANENVADFRSWWQVHKISALPPDGTFRIEAGGTIVEYDGIWIRYDIKAECTISQMRTSVTIYERSLISTEDRCYSLALRHPTRGVLVNFSLEGLSNWVVKPPVASAQLYKKGSQAVQIEKFHKDTCSARMSGWTLPGVAMVIEWSPS